MHAQDHVASGVSNGGIGMSSRIIQLPEGVFVGLFGAFGFLGGDGAQGCEHCWIYGDGII